MATVLTLITDTLVELGIIGSGETSATGEDGALALSRLQSMIDTFNAESLLVLSEQADIYTLPANTQSPTIGQGSPAANFVAVRPVSIKAANTIDAFLVRRPIDVRGDRDWWASIQNRGAVGIPEQLWYNPVYPNGVINLYPVPSTSMQLELFTETQVDGAALGLSTTLSLAPAYYEMLLYNLAWRLATPFGRNPANYEAAASRSRATVKAKNIRIPKLTTDVPLMGGRW